jgi:membrane protein
LMFFSRGWWWSRGAPAPPGSLVVLLMWVYYSAQIFLLGAEFTRAFAYSRGSHVATLGALNVAAD